MKLLRDCLRVGYIIGFLICLIAAAGSGPTITQAPTDPHSSYSPTVTVQAADTIVLAAGGYKGPGCVVFREVSRSPGLSLPEKDLAYGLFSADGSSQLSVDGSPASAGETLAAVFPAGAKPKDRVTLNFLVEVFPTSLPPRGTQSITLAADLYASAYPPSGGLQDSVTFTISFHVGTYYDVSVVSTGAAFSLASTTAALAFGALTPNASRGADVLVKSNISYSLSLTSASGGSFVNATDGSKLPYSLTSNGSVITLVPATAVLLVSGSPAGFGTPTRYALVVTVLPFVTLPTAGAYSDTITVTLSAP